MRPPESEESEEEEEEEDDGEPVRIMPRTGGGKMLSRMRPPQSGSEEEEDDDVMEVDPPEKKTVYASPRGGKQLHCPEPEEEEDEAPKTTIMRSPAGGKQLRRPEPEPPEPKTSISRSPAGGKQLRRPESEEEKEEPKSTISRSPVGGKQLRRPESEEEKEKPKSTISRSPAGGKQLRRPEPEETKKTEKATISRSPGGGKQLRRPEPKEESEDEDELFGDDDDDDEDDDYEETFVPKPASRGRPKRGAASRKKIVEEPEDMEEDIFGDDDVSSDEEQELDINNTEALIRDDEDRKYLDSLPELEREAILGERFEKLKAEQDMKKAIREARYVSPTLTRIFNFAGVGLTFLSSLHLRRKESEKAGQGKPATKRKAAPAKKSAKKARIDDDAALAKKLAGRRESARDKDAKGAKSKKAAALAALKTLKKERKMQKQRMEDSDDSELDFGDDSDDDSDDDYEEGGVMPWQKKKEAESEKEKKAETTKKVSVLGEETTMPPVAEANLEDFRKVTIPRRRLARWCNEPYFEAAVLECFVRLFIGEDDNGEKVYRLCEIVDVKDGVKTYKFPVANQNDKPVSTNKTLRLRFGKSERDFLMSLVSDAVPDEKDVQKYINVQRDNRLEIISKRRANKLRRLQDDLVNNYTYTKEDIERNLEQRKKQGKSVGKLGSELTRAEIAVQGARGALAEAESRLAEAKRNVLETDDAAKEAELVKIEEEARDAVEKAKKNLDEKLEEEQKVIQQVEDRKSRLKQRTKERDWAKVNQRAIQMNQRSDREAGKVDEKQSGSTRKKEFDPYARRKVKPKILWEVGQDEDKVEDSKTEEKKEEALKDVHAANDAADNSSTPSLVQEHNEKSTARSESHQFAIDEEGLAQSSATSLILGSKKGSNGNRARKGLSLSEYLERKANGSL